MKLRLPLALAAALLATFSLTYSTQADTILTFDGTESNRNLDRFYGSYAVRTTPFQSSGIPGYKVEGKGTPNIGLVFSPTGTTGTNTSNPILWQAYGGDNIWGSTPVGGVANGGAAQIEAATSIVEFVPNRYNASVSLGSFNFLGWSTGQAATFYITVTGSFSPDTLLYEQTLSWVGDTSKPYFGIPLVDLSSVKGGLGETLKLTLVRKAGAPNDLAVDNIRFSQTGYDGTVLSRTLVEGASASWVSDGWKKANADAPWVDATTTVPVVAELRGGATTGSTLLLANSDIRVVDGISVTSGIVTLSGGSVSLIGHAVLDISAGAKLNLDTVLSVTTGTFKGEPDVVHIEGDGLVVIKKDQVWGNVGGSGHLQLDGNLTLNGSNNAAFGVHLSGTGTLLKEGTATTVLSSISGLTGNGKVQIEKGRVEIGEAAAAIGDSGKRINTSKSGTVVFDVSNEVSHTWAPTVAGSGFLALSVRGTKSSAAGENDTKLDMSQSDFEGKIQLDKGIINLETSVLTNSKGKKDFTLLLNGGGLVYTAPVGVTFENDIQIGAGGGYVRTYSNFANTITYSGDLSSVAGEVGTFSHVDGGTITFTGDWSKYNGNFSHDGGATIFDMSGKVAHFNNFSNTITRGGNGQALVEFKSGTFNIDGIVNLSGDSQTKITGASVVINAAKNFILLNQNSILAIENGTLNVAGQLQVNGGGNNWALINQTGGVVNASSVLMANWNNTGVTPKRSEYLLNGGEINVSGTFQSGNDGYGALVVSGGVANLNKYYLHVGPNSGGVAGGGKLEIKGGRVNIGQGGIQLYVEKGKNPSIDNLGVTLSGGTLGAMYSWSTSLAGNTEPTIPFLITLKKEEGSQGIVVDTTSTLTKKGVAITWNVVVKGDGALNVDGLGTMVLSGNNEFTGGTTLKSGTLSLQSANALGAAGKRNLVVTGNGILLNPGTDTRIDILDIKSEGKVNIGGSGVKNSLSLGSLAGNGVFVMDIFADNTSDSLSFQTALGSANTSVTLNLFANGDVLNKEFTLINKVGTGTIKISSDYRKSLVFTQRVDNGDLKVSVSGGFDTQSLIWQNTASVGTWKVGTGGSAAWSGAASGKEGGFFNADNVTFNAPAAVDEKTKYQTINLEGILVPKSVTVVTEEDKNYRFTNVDGTVGYLTGEMALVKNGAGVLILDTSIACNYSGATTVNAGTLEFAAGSYSGTSIMTAKAGAVLKIHDVLSNKLIIDGSLAFAFAGTSTTDLGALDNVTWGAESSLMISEGVVKGGAGMFKGKTISVEEGGAFDLAGINRSAQRYNLELSGQGVLVNGKYTGALMNSSGDIGANAGINNLLLKDDAMISVSGGNASGNFTFGNRYTIKDKLDLNGHALTKTGYGILRLGASSGVTEGTLRIAEGGLLISGDNYGSAGKKTTIEVLSGAGITLDTKHVVYADVVLDSSDTDLSLDYVARNYAAIFCYSAARENTVNYAGNLTLINGGTITPGWGYSNDSTNSSVMLTGENLSGTGTLYIDTSGASTAFNEDSDTGRNRYRHLYLASNVSGIDGIQMVGRSVLQLSTAYADGISTGTKNATINGGLKIVGSDVNIIKIITTGTDAVTYTGLNFGITAGLERGMELRIQPENTTNSQLTTLNDTLGTLQKINVKAGGKLSIGGTSNLKVNDDFLIDGENAEFLLSGGSLNIGKNVTVAGTSRLSMGGAGTKMDVGGVLTLGGLNAGLLAEGGQLKIAGNLNMSGGALLNMSGNDTLVEIGGNLTVSGQNAHLTVNSGTFTILGTGESWLGSGGNNNRGIFDQTGGTVNVTKFLLSAYPTPNNAGSEYNLKGGTLNASDYFQVGNDGGATFIISGGIANIEKLMIGKWTGSTNLMEIHLRDTGRLNIGTGGIVRNNTSILNTRLINLSGGTLGASKNWSTKAELTLLKISDAAVGVTVDTTLTMGGEGEIKWLGDVKGEGKLNVTGTGTLELGGINSFTGDVTVKGSSTLNLNTTKGLSAKVILQESGIFRMGGDNMTAASAFDVQGGQLILDKTGASVGNVGVKGGKLLMSFAGVKAGAVTVSGGAADISADATLASLGISGGATNITAGILSVSDNKIDLSGTGLLKFAGKGNVASGMTVNTAGATSTVELGQLTGADDALAAYQFTLTGAGVLKVNDPALKSSYKGTSTGFNGRVDVLAGELTLESQMTQATANISGTGDSAGRLIFTGASEQVKALLGTGKVSFTNNAVNITSTALFGGFNGTLVLGDKITRNSTNQVKFSYNGASLLGQGTTLLFTGNNGELTLNNTGGIFRESVKDVIMETNGVIHLTGNGMELRLNGDSWKGITEEKLPLLIFDMADKASNFVYVDPSSNELDINRLRIKTEEGLVVGVVKDVDGKLFADVPTELTVNQGGSLVQSYTLSVDHSPSGNHELIGHTSVRSLSITSSDTGAKKNTGLILKPGVKLSIALGELNIFGDAAYTISGGSMGFHARPADDNLAQFYIVQDAKGGATVSTTLDDTIFTFRKAGSEELVMTGDLKNRGGVQVDSGRLVLTGSSQKYANAGLTNKDELVLGDGKKTYTVNYSKLTATKNGITTFREKAALDKGFVVDSAGQLHLQMGMATSFDTAFVGKGTTLIENKTQITLPQGSLQSFTVENGSGLTVNLSAAGSPGATMKGNGEINLVNTTGSALILSPENMSATSWLGFMGTLKMVSEQAMTLNLSLMGDGASVLVSKGGTLNDIATESVARKYHVTLGDLATWKLADGAVYGGTLTLGTSGVLAQTGVSTYGGDISGGVLSVQGGTLTLLGESSHAATEVGENTTVIGSSAHAFGKSLVLNKAGALGQINSMVTTESLLVNSESGRLEILKDKSLTVSGATDFRGILSGEGALNLESSSTLAGTAQDFVGNLNLSGGGQYDLSVSDMGTAAIHVSGLNTALNITGNTALGNNLITMEGGTTLSGGAGFGGRLNITGEDSVTANGTLNVDSLHMLTPQAKLVVRGDLNINNGGSFLLSDHNTQGAFGAIVSSGGVVTVSGVFGVDLDVNNAFLGGEETNVYQLFKGTNGLVINTPAIEVNGGNPVRFDLDISMREFFTLNQDGFTGSGLISISRKEMTCYLLDPSYVTGDGEYVDGFGSPNSTSYLGANSKNDGATYPEIFFYDKSYTIAANDNAYRLTNGDAWMNFHVAMTDQQLDAPTKLVVRDNWMSKTENAGGVILSVRGNADNTYSGGTQIFKAKVKVDGTLNEAGTGTMSAGDVYFFGTGAVEAIGESAEIILNTGGDGSNAEYLFYNDFQLQQGAVLTQTSSKNVLMGNLAVKDYATLANLTGEDLVLSGSRLNANNLKIKGAGGNELNTIRLEGVTGDKVNAKFTTVDVDSRGQLAIGRNATANITNLYIDQGSAVTMTEGGVLAVKQIKNGANGRGDVILAGGIFKAMGDFAITENGATYSVTSASTFDTNGYYMEINQYLAGWSDFTVTGGGKMLLVKDLSSFDSHATITGTSTHVTISKDKTLAGTWTVKDGGTLKTEENVSIRGILNMEKGGSTDFGVGTKMDLATLNFKNGSTYAGFLKGEGSTVNFENGSHFQVKTEDLRKLTDGTEKALLSSGIINISNGKGFFNFNGGDGVVNEAILDAGNEKTLIIGTEELNVGGLSDSVTRTGTLGVEASELTGEQLAAMVGENNYRWLSFVLTADKVGETGSKINVTVTRNVNFSELAESSNEIAIAPTLSYIGMEGGKADSKLQGEGLNMLGLALTKATGDAHQMLSNISLSTSSIMAGYSVQRENLRRHTLELRDRAVQERPCALRNQYETLENTLWASGQGGTYSVDGDNNAVGHTTSLWGGQLGVSRCMNDNLVLGLAFTYTTSDITLDKGMGEATSDAYYIDLYAKYHKDNWNVTGILTGGFTDMETDRNMAIEGFSSRTKGSSSGNQLMGMVEVGYEFDLDGDRSNIIEPFAALTAGYSSIDGFDETGADTAGLNVASQSNTSCSIGAGVRYVKEFSTSSDELLRGRFEVRAMILQDLTDNEVDVEAGFIGANGHSFSQKSTEIGKTGFLLGTGVVVPTSTNMAIFADLNGEFRSSETGCNANIGVKYSF